MPIWKAPEDFKPFFLEVRLSTDKDGLFSNNIKATRFQGKYDPQADDKKKFLLSDYDMPTLLGVAGRLAGPTFKAASTMEGKCYPADIKERNATEKVEGKPRLVIRGARRLPPSTAFRLVMRVTKKAADGSLGVRFVSIVQGVMKNGVAKGVELAKTDPAYRHIRKTSKTLPAAFKDCVLPPKKTRGGKKKEAEGDDE